MDHLRDLENFVRAHREALENQDPRPEIWNRLSDSLQASAKYKPAARQKHVLFGIRRRRPWMAAAAILGSVLVLAAFVRSYQVTSATMAAIPADMQEARAYYEQRIAAKIERIKTLEAGIKDRDTSLWHLFGQRDGEYSRLRRALAENPGNAHVRAAFVEYYRSRLEVLNSLEDHIKRQDVPHP
jgi:hypothetical protein